MAGGATSGPAGEQLVADWLEQQGYEIVSRNVRLGHLEIDIVARDDRVIVVVEVRCRAATSFTSPLSSLDAQKRLRTRRAGERLWARRFRHDPRVDRLRFDVACVVVEEHGLRLDEYVRAAF